MVTEPTDPRTNTSDQRDSQREVPTEDMLNIMFFVFIPLIYCYKNLEKKFVDTNYFPVSLCQWHSRPCEPNSLSSPAISKEILLIEISLIVNKLSNIQEKNHQIQDYRCHQSQPQFFLKSCSAPISLPPHSLSCHCHLFSLPAY